MCEHEMTEDEIIYADSYGDACLFCGIEDASCDCIGRPPESETLFRRCLELGASVARAATLSDSERMAFIAESEQAGGE
jgi:hypothetical protein